MGVIECRRAIIAAQDQFIPPEYQSVEWIRSFSQTENNEAPIIRTGAIATKNTRIIVDFLYPELTETNTTYVVGTIAEWVRMNIYCSSSGNDIRYGFLTLFGSTGAQRSVNQRYIVELENGKVSVNGLLTTFDTQVNTSSSEICICGRYYSGKKQTSSAQVYSAKIYDGSILVRNYFPCYRKSDGEIGLYDVVNKVFYTKNGTIDFEKGNDI